MPDFYSGPSSATSFSQGLMAGYEFVDRIKQRRQEAQDRARQEALAERQDTRAEQSFTIAKDDHARNLQRQNDEDLAHVTGAVLLRAGGADKLTPDDRAQLIKTGRASNAQWQNLTDDEVWQNVENNAMLHDDRVTEQDVNNRKLLEKEGAYEELLGSLNQRTNTIRNGGAPPPGNVATAPPGNQAPTLAQTGANVVQQAQVPSDVVTTYQRGYTKATAPAPISKDLPQARLAPPSEAKGLERQRGVHAAPVKLSGADLSNEVAKDPLGYASSWVDRRNDVSDHTQRNMTDAKVYSALQADLDSAKTDYDKADDPRTKATLGRRMVTRDAQIQALAKTRGNEVVDKQAARGAAPGDKAATTLGQAAAAFAEGKLPVTQDQLRGLQTTVERAATGKTTRFSPLQIKRLAHAAALGLVSPEQAEHLMRYGSMDKPEKPSVQPLGDGYAALVTQNGVSLIQLPGAGKPKGGGAESAAQSRLLANDRMEQAFNFFKETFGKGEAQAHMNTFLQTVKREGGQLVNRSGIPLIDPRSGAFDPGLTDPGEMAELLDTYKRYNEGEVSPWIFKGGKTYTQYAPEAGGNVGGWSVTPVGQ